MVVFLVSLVAALWLFVGFFVTVFAVDAGSDNEGAYGFPLFFLFCSLSLTFVGGILALAARERRWAFNFLLVAAGLGWVSSIWCAILFWTVPLMDESWPNGLSILAGFLLPGVLLISFAVALAYRSLRIALAAREEVAP